MPALQVGWPPPGSLPGPVHPPASPTAPSRAQTQARHSDHSLSAGAGVPWIPWREVPKEGVGLTPRSAAHLRGGLSTQSVPPVMPPPGAAVRCEDPLFCLKSQGGSRRCLGPDPVRGRGGHSPLLLLLHLPLPVPPPPAATEPLCRYGQCWLECGTGWAKLGGSRSSGV